MAGLTHCWRASRAALEGDSSVATDPYLRCLRIRGDDVGSHRAARLSSPHFDTDDYYWERTDPPFTTKREPRQRVDRFLSDVEGVDDWILSGSLVDWGDLLIPRFTLAVFTYADTPTRIARLRTREKARYAHRIESGGDMHRQHLEFIAWAQSYDTAAPPTRSRSLHETWMQKLPCRVLRLETTAPPADAVELILTALHGKP